MVMFAKRTSLLNLWGKLQCKKFYNIWNRSVQVVIAESAHRPAGVNVIKLFFFVAYAAAEKARVFFHDKFSGFASEALALFTNIRPTQNSCHRKML